MAEYKQCKMSGLWVPEHVQTKEPPPFPPRLDLPGNEKAPTRMDTGGPDNTGRQYWYYGTPRPIAKA